MINVTLHFREGEFKVVPLKDVPDEVTEFFTENNISIQVSEGDEPGNVKLEAFFHGSYDGDTTGILSMELPVRMPHVIQFVILRHVCEIQMKELNRIVREHRNNLH